MTGLLICAAVVWWFVGVTATNSAMYALRGDRIDAAFWGIHSLALIAVALWLAYAAGGA